MVSTFELLSKNECIYLDISVEFFFAEWGSGRAKKKRHEKISIFYHFSCNAILSFYFILFYFFFLAMSQNQIQANKSEALNKDIYVALHQFNIISYIKRYKNVTMRNMKRHRTQYTLAIAIVLMNVGIQEKEWIENFRNGMHWTELMKRISVQLLSQYFDSFSIFNHFEVDLISSDACRLSCYTGSLCASASVCFQHTAFSYISELWTMILIAAIRLSDINRCRN